MAEERNVRKVRVGKVVSDKMDKTVVVAVERKVPHALYNKPMVSTKRFKAHDENNECQIGDTVKIVGIDDDPATNNFECCRQHWC